MNIYKSFCIISLLSIFFWGCTENEEKVISIDGLWADSTGSNFSDCYAVFAQEGNQIYMGHFLKFNEQPFFEKGIGTRVGDTLIYDVKVVQQIPGWSTAGHHELIIEDATTLRGSYKDNKGNSGPIVLKRVE